METLKKQVRRAQERLTFQRFLACLARSASAAILAAAVLAGLGNYLAWGVDAWMWLAGALGLAVGVAAVWAFWTRQGALDAAVELDRRFGLKERVSSTLALGPDELETDAGRALAEDAIRRVESLEVSKQFRVTLAKRSLWPLAPAILAFLAAMLVNPADDGQNAATASAVATTKQIKQSTDILQKKLAERRKKAQEKGLKDAEELFKKLEQGTEDLARKKDMDRNNAMVKLNDLAKDLEKRREELGGNDGVKQQLDQLKDMVKGPADDFAKAVQKGDFEKAVKELDKLKDQLAGGKLSEKDKADLTKQLDQMRDKLEKLAEAHRESEEDLKKQVDQLRKAGRLEEASKLQEKLDKLAQQAPQMDQLRKLAQKLGQSSQAMKQGKMSDAVAQMDQLGEELGKLQEKLDEMEMLDDAMEQLAQAKDRMKCDKCGGFG
ncbi:MAG: hypothetical protein ACYC35_15690 [Pirellulales bacterium]